MIRRNVSSALASVAIASPVLIGALYSSLSALGLAGVGARGFTLDGIVRVITAADTWRAVAWTFATAGVATALALAIALALALRLRTSRIGRAAAMLPMAVPHIAAALAALLLLGQSGLLSRIAYALGVIEGPGDFPALVYDRTGAALVFTFVWKELPYLTLTAMAVLLTGTRDLEEVARTLGATPHQAFWRVTWPQLWRGTAPAVVAVLAFLVGQYEMPALLAPSDPTPLSILIFERANDPNLSRRREAHVLGLLALAIAVLLAFVHTSWQTRTDPGRQ
jgi:putative spermidine/putrescine transport system permease protein